MVALLFKSLVGHGAKNKFVPKELFHADDGAVKAFLEGYVAGDGWVGKDIISMNTVSENLAYGLCGLLLKVGVLPRFYVWNPAKTKEIGMRTIRQSTLYYVKVAISSPRKFFEEKAYRETKNLNKKCLEQENRFLIPISKIKTHAYKGPVYNLEVKSEHSYLANFVSVANCQNAGISQQRSEDAISKVPFTSPEEIVEQAVAAGVEGIAYTYTEPTIFAEYALDTMRLARKKGLYNAWVSNGYMSKECIDAIAPFLDAINIDLKGNAEFYKEVCGNANIDFIKENISYLHKKKVHLEVTCLLVPDYNDNEKGFREISEFIASIDKKMPLHFTAFWPQYKMRHLPPTDLQKLQKAKEIALKAGLEFVFIGNTGEEESTNCPKCGDLLVRRIGFAAEAIGLDKNGKCKKCGEKTGIIV
jgi:pyruvate formate lyase activating enzyme